MPPADNVVLFPEPKPRRHRAERVTLTSKRIAEVAPTRKRQRISDATVPGLHLVVTPAGAKSFVVRGGLGKGRGRPVLDVTIGPADAVPLTEARERARQILAQLRLGQDPRQRSAETPVGKVVDAYIAHHAERGTATADKITRCLARATTGLRGMPMSTVSLRQWSERIERSYRDRGLAPATDDAKWLRAMTKWATVSGLVEPCPALVVPGPKPSRTDRAAAETRRANTWTLRRSEWPTFWAATEASTDPGFIVFLRLLALVGLRRREASLARWADIDLEAGIWVIPAVNAKSARPHTVYLGPLTRRLLEGLPRTAGGLVFPGRGDVPMTGWSRRLAPVSAAMGRPVQLHGLRRGYRTALAELRVDVDVAELMIAHARPGLEARYNHAEFEEQRRESQDKLEVAWMEAVQ